ncbi:MAG: 3,4-dihydroxy-2-butanone-4-phosphate synthase [Candidatus Cloacimonetes bacterium]|nr:3,4-dihydroxy-2-butanone-4-phosphate synthase [Candidatus Cloacimonadota bacterium]
MLDKIVDAIKDIKNGKMIIVVDDENRENEGDLVIAAEKITPKAVNFMITKGKGLVCAPMLNSSLKKLNLPQMVEKNSDTFETAFTISVDHKSSKTGISAFERATTILELTKENSQDFKAPGHIFPLRAKENGILEREGHTEAAVDLARLAGLKPFGVICEIIGDDGKMARLPKLKELAKEWEMKIISIKDLIEYRKSAENILKPSSKVKLPTKFGDFMLYAFQDSKFVEPHLALVKGNIENAPDPILVRVHSECFTGDVFGSEKCDCGTQLHEAMRQIEDLGEGILIYLRQEGRGIGLLNKLKAYELQEKGADTVQANLELGFEPELRDFEVAARILKFFKLHKINLLTNNPIKVSDLKKNGISVVERFPIEIEPTCSNKFYLKTKKEKMGHLLKSF